MKLKDFFWSSKTKEVSEVDKQRYEEYKRVHAQKVELDKRIDEINAKYGPPEVNCK